MTERLVLLNGRMVAMDARGTPARALAFEDGRIVRVGGDHDFQDLTAQGWPVLDLAGKTVLPGFIDAHQHLMLSGLQAAGLRLEDARTIDDILERVAAATGGTEKGTWIRGGNLNEQNLTEKRLPTRRDLDRVSPDHPVYLLHATCHLCSFNSKALEILQIPLNLAGLDLEAGRPTGVVRDPGILTHVLPAMAKITPEEVKIESLLAAARMALDRGITTMHALDGGDFGPGDTRVIWANRDKLPVRLVCFNQSMDLAEVRELGLPRIGGCICADGAFEAHTAALFEPYADEPDNYGTLTFSQAVMDDFILKAHRAGLQIAVHCESDRSIEQVLWAMEKALRAFPRSDHRHRIEHLELPTFNQIDRLARAGITASMQPAFIPAFIGSKDMEYYAKLLGRPRLKMVHPYRTILDSGLLICGGSDSPVTPYHPLAGVQAATNHPNPEERVSRVEALKMFTIWAAWSAFEEKDKGSLEPGKLADLVVLGDDPLTVDEQKISSIPIEMVFVGGRQEKPRADLA